MKCASTTSQFTMHTRAVARSAVRWCCSSAGAASRPASRVGGGAFLAGLGAAGALGTVCCTTSMPAAECAKKKPSRYGVYAGIPEAYANDFKEIVFTERVLREKAKELAAEISADVPEGAEVVVVGLLKGAFQVVTDVARYLTVPNTVEFMIVSSYGNETTVRRRSLFGTVRFLSPRPAPRSLSLSLSLSLSRSLSRSPSESGQRARMANDDQIFATLDPHQTG